jgi:hypothetical protein
MLCEFYYLLSPSEVVRVSKEFRDLRNETNLPWELIRICDVWNGDFIGLRKLEGEWKAVFLSRESSDEMVLYDKAVKPLILADSFSAWLKKTIDRDGEFPLPGLGSPWSKDGPAPYERLE